MSDWNPFAVWGISVLSNQLREENSEEAREEKTKRVKLIRKDGRNDKESSQEKDKGEERK